MAAACHVQILPGVPSADSSVGPHGEEQLLEAGESIDDLGLQQQEQHLTLQCHVDEVQVVASRHAMFSARTVLRSHLLANINKNKFQSV